MTDRAIPLPVDSYRPSGSTQRPAPPAPLLKRSSNSSNLALIQSAIMKNPNSATESSNSFINHSLGVSSSVPNRSMGLSNPSSISATVTYIPLEAMMEHKAKALGQRHKFFQYLQMKRASRFPIAQTG
jgi:hypothetical protein